jgi:hypothetical protein
LGLSGGAAMPRTFVEPRTPLEEMLAGCWAEILQLEQVGINDDFFALGGDSLSVAHLLAWVYDTINLEMEVSRFFEAPTIAEMARDLERLKQMVTQPEHPISAIRVSLNGNRSNR